MGVRIQELPETTGIKKEDVLIVEDGQGTKKGTVQQLDETLGVSQLKEDLDNQVGLKKVIFIDEKITTEKEFTVDTSLYFDSNIEIEILNLGADAYIPIFLYDSSNNLLYTNGPFVKSKEKFTLDWNGKRIAKYRIENPNTSTFKVLVYQNMLDSLLDSEIKKGKYILSGDINSFSESKDNTVNVFDLTNALDKMPNKFILSGIGTKLSLKDRAFVTHNINLMYNYKYDAFYTSDENYNWSKHGRSKVFVGKNREINSFSKGLEIANTLGNCDLYVDSGTYNLIEEIGESNLSSYIFPNTSGHGPYIGNGTRLFMASGAKVVCNYTGTNKTVNSDFSILNVCFEQGKGDFEIYGGEFIGSNIRYVVHDEATGVSQYRHEYHDCKMTIDNSNNANWNAKQCIGGGLGQYGTVIIDGGIYNSINIELQDEKGTITYHNPDKGTSTTFKNLVVIKNVYFENGTCFVSCLGDDTTSDATMFICNNCSMLHEPFANGLDNPYVNHNVTIKKWNNEIRTS
jgi:hypothetical protein